MLQYQLAGVAWGGAIGAVTTFPIGAVVGGMAYLGAAGMNFGAAPNKGVPDDGYPLYHPIVAPPLPPDKKKPEEKRKECPF